MGTDSVDEIIDDTTVLFANPNASKTRSTNANGTSSNPSTALTYKLEKKLRSTKIPSSKVPADELDSDHAEPSSASKIALVHPSQLLIPAKSATDQPLVVYDLDSDEDVEFSRIPKAKFSSNKEASARLLANDFDIELHSDDEDGDTLELIRPQQPRPSSVCCKFSCNIQ